MEVDFRRRRACFYNYGAYTVPPRDPDVPVVVSPASYFVFERVVPEVALIQQQQQKLASRVNPIELNEAIPASHTMTPVEFMAKNEAKKVAEFHYIPDDSIPFCWFLGSGYKASVTLYESVLTFF
jgi:hypothetical protein